MTLTPAPVYMRKQEPCHEYRTGDYKAWSAAPVTTSIWPGPLTDHRNSGTYISWLGHCTLHGTNRESQRGQQGIYEGWGLGNMKSKRENKQMIGINNQAS